MERNASHRVVRLWNIILFWHDENVIETSQAALLVSDFFLSGNGAGGSGFLFTMMQKELSCEICLLLYIQLLRVQMGQTSRYGWKLHQTEIVKRKSVQNQIITKKMCFFQNEVHWLLHRARWGNCDWHSSVTTSITSQTLGSWGYERTCGNE